MKIFYGVIIVIVLLGAGWFAWKYIAAKNAPLCGGIVGKSCPAGYVCQGSGDYPDAQGRCFKD